MYKSALTTQEDHLITYTFKVVVEPDEERWRAYVPSLEHLGAATWGYSREEALQHIREVLEMMVEELVAEGKAIPGEVQVAEEVLVSITLSAR